MMRNLDVYLALERVMLELDKTEHPLADEIRDDMEPIWYRLSPEEVALLDSRGTLDASGRFQAPLPFPTGERLPPTTVSGKRFASKEGWQAPPDWKKTA